MTVRVLHVIKGLGPGGAEALLVNQARATDDPELTFRVAYLVPWKDHNAGRLRQLGWTTGCLDGARPWDLRWLGRLRSEIVGGGIDVVHGHSPLVASMSRLLVLTIPKRSRPSLVYTEHNEWPRHKTLTRWLNRATIRREDKVLAVSAGVCSSMPRSLDVEVLVHGIDVEQVAASAGERDVVRAELGVAPSEHLVGIVANFRREKGYDTLLTAASMVLAEAPSMRFVSVGQGPLEDEIRRLHDDLGLGPAFQILGYREDAVRVMSAFDTFVLSSRHEGLPVVLMEARALGLPIVATDVGGVAEALESGVDALVPPDDAEALARAVLKAGRRESIGREVGDSGNGMFEAASAARRLADIYGDLVR